MGTEVVYNIPVSMIPAYRGRRVIVRSEDPEELASALAEEDFDNLVAVRLLGLTSDIGPLASWGRSVPVELLMLYPEKQFPLLYRYAKLADTHPVRVCISTVPGFSKAVRVAAALRLLIKLEVMQPDRQVLDEMLEVVEFYLHHASVVQPIEFFHSTLISFYRHEHATLWQIQEEDPAQVCYVTDDGSETIDRWPAFASSPSNLASFVSRFQDQLLAERAECLECEFLKNCGGYFKWPYKDYGCSGVKTIFRRLKEAAAEIQHGIDAFSETETGVSR